MLLVWMIFRMQSFGMDSVAQRHRNKFFKNWDIFTNFLEENRQHIFYIFVYFVITIGKIFSNHDILAELYGGVIMLA